MDAEKKQHTRKGFKGSVLFTILVVMMVMLILMLTTIALAGNASRRAYWEYNDRQTTSTARSVVDTVISQLSTPANRALGIDIVSTLQSNHSAIVNVDVNGGNDLGQGFGTVDSLTFEYVAEDSATGINITGSGKPIIKVTASVTQGGVTSTYSQYCIGQTNSNNKTGGGGGLIALGGFEGTNQPGVDANSPAYFGINDDFDVTKKVALAKANQGGLKGAIINSSAAISDSGFKINLSPGENVTVMGNLFMDNGDQYINTVTDGVSVTDALKDYAANGKVEENSFIYTAGALVLGTGNSLKLHTAENGVPMNIYCGRLVMEKAIIEGRVNIFCYNTGNESDSDLFTYSDADATAFSNGSWSRLGTSDGSEKTSLITWAEKNASYDLESYQGSDHDTGYFATNGNLELQGVVNVANDMYVKGKLRVSDSFSTTSVIQGDLYVDGTIEDPDGKLKDVVKGETKKNATTYSSVINAFKNGSLTLDSLSSKTIKTAQKVHDQFYETKTITDPTDPSQTIEIQSFKKAVNKSNCIINDSTKVYKGTGNTFTISTLDGNVEKSGNTNGGSELGSVSSNNYYIEITDDCILTGKFSDRTNILIKPTKDIWINVHNLELSSSKIIIDNYNYDDGGTPDDTSDDIEKRYTVNFFLPTDVNDSSQVDISNTISSTALQNYKNIAGTSKNSIKVSSDGSMIITRAYLEHLKGDSEINFVTYPTKDSDYKNNWQFPAVNIFAPELYSDDKTETNVVLEFSESINLTADICTPGAEFKSSVGHSYLGTRNLKYNGTPIEAQSVNFIGSVIVNRITSFSDQTGMAYIDLPSGGTPIISGGLQYQWTPINGYADY